MKYTVVRSNRRTVALEITRDAQVLVRAPRQISDRAIARYVAENETWIREHLARQLARMDAYPEPTPEEEALYRRQAKEYLPALTAWYAEKMGVRPGGVKITSARTRFGSCSGDGHICYSWRLMQYPQEAIEYVVVHELCHISIRNHSPAFYAAVAAVLPDYKARRALLKGVQPED